METNGDSPANTQKGDTNPLPAGQSVPKAQQVQPIDLAAPSSMKNEIAANAKQESGSDEKANKKQPYIVKIVESEEFSRFEKRTILLGWLGVGLGFLSLLAACGAAYFIYKQFTEMASQTKILSKSAADTATAGGRQTDIMQGQLKTANDTFNAANRPYVGISTITPIFLKRGPDGKPQPTSHQDSEAHWMNFNAEIKNFGTVPGINFRAHWRIFSGKKEAKLSGVPQQPSTIYPGQSLYLFGQVGTDDFSGVMDETIPLALDISISYDGPANHYDQCDRWQFKPQLNLFVDLGPSCKSADPYNRAQKPN